MQTPHTPRLPFLAVFARLRQENAGVAVRARSPTAMRTGFRGGKLCDYPSRKIVDISG